MLPYRGDIAALYHRAVGSGDALGAREQLARLLASLSADELVAVDRQARSALPLVRPEQVELMLAAQAGLEHGWVVAATLGFYRDGRVRERATRWLARHVEGLELPFLLLRMNDWVAPIRALAREAVEERLRPRLGAAWIAALPMLTRLERWGRTDHSSFLARARSFLRGPALAKARRRGLADARFTVRREAYRLALAAEPESAAELLSRAAADPMPPLRRWALDTLRRDRRLQRRELLEPFLLALNLGERQLAQELLRVVAPGFDLADHYRRSLDAGQCLRPALFGLGECGDRGDLPRVERYLQHERTAVRRAAIYALCWLNAEGEAGRLVELLADARGRVSKDAANNLCRSAHLIAAHAPRLRELTAEGELPHCRENAQRVLAAGRSYDQRWRC